MTTIRTTGLLAERSLLLTRRNPALLLATLIIPVVMMLVMLATFGSVVTQHTGLPYIARLAPLTVLTTIVFGAGTSATGYFDDVHNGLLDRIRTMPVTATGLLAGRVAGDLVRIVAIAVVATLVAIPLGFRFSGGPLAALGALVVVLLFGCLFTVLALSVAVHVRSEAAALNILNVPGALLLFLSSGYVPRTAFPGFVQPIVLVNPLSLGTETLIGLSRGTGFAGPLLGILAWTVAGTVLFGSLAARRLRRA